MAEQRIQFLDGYRGLAIVWVVLYHAYVRWPSIVPFGDNYSEIWFLAEGRLGVQLFFLVSGFVILMTLEKCHSPGQFLYRRWLRLFPAMLICSLMIYISASYFSERPAGLPSVRSLLPGLSFIAPDWWRILLGSPQGILEGAFWSLYVEFKFYVVAALVYFWRGRNALVLMLISLFAFAVLVEQLSQSYSSQYLLNIYNLLQLLSFAHFGWFAAGACFYIFRTSNDRKWIYLAILVALLSSAFVRDLAWRPAITAGLVSLLFAVSMISEFVQRILCNRLLLFFGFISYPLYLLHENTMISLIVKLAVFFPDMPLYALPVLPIVFVIIVAYFVANYVEPLLSFAIRRAVVNTKSLLLWPRIISK